MDSARINLVVIRSSDLDRAERFYGGLGLSFNRHRHGNGPEHLCCERGQTVFEVYPPKRDGVPTTSIRLGFVVANIAAVLENVESNGGQVVAPAEQSPWGLRAVIDDPDGHRVELTEETDIDDSSASPSGTK